MAWLPPTAHGLGLAPFTGAWFGTPVLYVVGVLGPVVAAYVLTRIMSGDEVERGVWAGVCFAGGLGAVVGRALLAYPGIWFAPCELVSLSGWVGLVPAF